LKQALGVPWENHKDIARYRKDLSEEAFASAFKFTVVRNPWDRLVSEYRFQTRIGRRRAERLHAVDGNGRKRNFEDWVKTVFNDPMAYEPRTWGGTVSPGIHRWSPQVDWVAPEGKLMVDMAIRFEEFEESLGALSAKLGRPIPPPGHEKRMIRRSYPEYYTPELRDLVGDYYAEDIRTFDYTYDSNAKRPASAWERLINPLTK